MNITTSDKFGFGPLVLQGLWGSFAEFRYKREPDRKSLEIRAPEFGGFSPTFAHFFGARYAFDLADESLSKREFVHRKSLSSGDSSVTRPGPSVAKTTFGTLAFIRFSWGTLPPICRAPSLHKSTIPVTFCAISRGTLIARRRLASELRNLVRFCSLFRATLGTHWLARTLENPISIDPQILPDSVRFSADSWGTLPAIDRGPSSARQCRATRRRSPFYFFERLTKQNKAGARYGADWRLA